MARRWVVGLGVAGVAAMAWCGAAQAEPGHEVTWALGGRMGVNASLLTPPDLIAEPNPPIPAFLGSGGGVGLSAEALYADVVGLGAELWTVSTGGRGRYRFVSAQGSYVVEQRLEASELQVPLLVKGQLPLGRVKPWLALGYTAIFQTSATYAVEAPVQTAILSPEPASYGLWTAGLGITVEVERFRFPVEVRGGWRSLSGDPAARAAWAYIPDESGAGTLTQLSVGAAWEAQLWVVVGVHYGGSWAF